MLMEVTANPLTTTEFPMLMILDTVQKLNLPQLDNNFVVFAYNCGDNDYVGTTDILCSTFSFGRLSFV